MMLTLVNESSESGDEEEEFEVVREAVAQMSVQELLPVSGNEMPVSCRKCILCGELSHTKSRLSYGGAKL